MDTFYLKKDSIPFLSKYEQQDMAVFSSYVRERA